MKQKIKLKDLTREQFKKWFEENKNKEVVIDIEIDLLTKKEKEYLEGVIKPFKEVIVYIKKVNSIGKQFQFIHIKLCNGESIYLPYFNFNEYYKNMKEHKEYTLKELDLER